MQDKERKFKIFMTLIKTFNIIFILGFAWIFTDAIAHVISSPVKATIYAIVGGCYIGAYGVMTSQMWTDQLQKDNKER